MKWKILLLEKPIQFLLHTVNDMTKVFLFFREIVSVDIDDHHLAFLVLAGPGFITFIQPFEIIKAYAVFKVAASFLDCTRLLKRVFRKKIWRLKLQRCISL